MAFDYKEYIREYMKEKVRYKKINFSVDKPEDMMLLAWIESHDEPATQYLKRLVKEDMEKHQKQP